MTKKVKEDKPQNPHDKLPIAQLNGTTRVAKVVLTTPILDGTLEVETEQGETITLDERTVDQLKLNSYDMEDPGYLLIQSRPFQQSDTVMWISTSQFETLFKSIGQEEEE